MFCAEVVRPVLRCSLHLRNNQAQIIFYFHAYEGEIVFIAPSSSEAEIRSGTSWLPPHRCWSWYWYGSIHAVSKWVIPSRITLNTVNLGAWILHENIRGSRVRVMRSWVCSDTGDRVRGWRHRVLEVAAVGFGQPTVRVEIQGGVDGLGGQAAGVLNRRREVNREILEARRAQLERDVVTRCPTPLPVWLG